MSRYRIHIEFEIADSPDSELMALQSMHHLLGKMLEAGNKITSTGFTQIEPEPGTHFQTNPRAVPFFVNGQAHDTRQPNLNYDDLVEAARQHNPRISLRPSITYRWRSGDPSEAPIHGELLPNASVPVRSAMSFTVIDATVA